MITKYKQKFQPAIGIIAQPFLSWNPHILTLLSVFFAVLFAFALVEHAYLLAGISWIGVIFDALDGYVARKSGKASQFGAFFDSTMDRISDFFYISAFGLAGFISWPLVTVGFITVFLISYTKARGESLLSNVVIQEGFMQRTERVILLFIIFLLFIGSLPNFAMTLFILFIVLNVLTVLQRMLLIKNLLH